MQGTEAVSISQGEDGGDQPGASLQCAGIITGEGSLARDKFGSRDRSCRQTGQLRFQQGHHLRGGGVARLRGRREKPAVFARAQAAACAVR